MKTKIKYQINKNYIIKKQNVRFICFKKVHRSYIELQNKLKTLEENLIHNKHKTEEKYNIM